MSHRRVLLAGLCSIALAGLLPAAGDLTESKVEKKYRLELAVSKAAPEKDTTETRTFFADVLLDKDGGRLLYAAQATPTLGVLKGDEKAIGKGDKPAKELYHFTLQARTWDEKDIDKSTRKFTVAVFRDENTGHLIYVSETGAVAVVAAPKEAPPKKAPETRWLYRMKLKVRPPGEFDFTFDTLKYNVEVYREADSGRLIYFAHNGNLAVSAPGKEVKAKEAKEPNWSHAFELRVRPPDQRDFNRDTPQFSLEVYDDENSETTLYVTNKFALAVVPGIKAFDMGKAKAAEWQRGLVGDKWSGEVFLDPNLDQLMFITSAGGFAVLPAK
jgi:hypothetical protein